ncbi:MAG: hypothetical protein JO141_00785 [Bradyrhizobium sp.]|nr:hypothetical protein [Bradyrhizobium sp.]
MDEAERELGDVVNYRLTEAQAREVERIQHDFHENKVKLATDEEMAAL